MNKKLHQSLKQYNKSKEDAIVPISGTLGIPLGGQKLVEVPNRQGFVYVKLKDNTSEVIQAYNSTVSTTYDLPVLVIRSNNIYRVLGRNLDLYRDWGNIPYLPKHGGQHSFNPALSMGADITWIYSQQIMPLLGYPSGTDGSPRISVAPYLVQDLSGNWKYVGNTGTISTTIYNPNTGSRAVMALVYLDTVSGNPYLLVNSGTYISESLTGTNQVAPYIPQITNPNHLPITAIRLLSGTSTLTWNNLYDARPFLRVVPTGSSGLIIQDEGILKGTATTLNVVGLNADISVSGSVARLFITGSNEINFGISTNEYYRGKNLAQTAFVSTINGTPSGTTLVYNAPSAGNESDLIQYDSVDAQTANNLTGIILTNTTRGTEAVVQDVVTSIKMIILTGTYPAGWVSGDTITTRQQASFQFRALQLKDASVIPAGATQLLLSAQVKDTAGSDCSLWAQDDSTISASKIVVLGNTSAANILFAGMLPPIPLASNRRILINPRNAGGATTLIVIRANGYKKG